MPRGKDLKQRKPRSDRHSPLDDVLCKGCRLHFNRMTLSKAGLCPMCGANRVSVACGQLRDKRGEIYEKWLAKTAASKAVRDAQDFGIFSA